MPLHSRRRFLQNSLAVGLTSSAGCVFNSGGGSSCTEGRTRYESDALLPQTASWPMYQYDAANTGHNPDASGPEGAGRIVWRYSACTEADSGAVVHNGRAYAGGVILNGQTGQQAGGDWHGHMSTPAIVGGTMYVSAFDLEARDAATGESLWTFQTDVDAGALPAPTVTAGTVYVPGSINDPILYAVDAETGDERWRFETGADIETPPAVIAETVYIVDETDTIYALDSETGDERWRVTFETDLSRSAPVVVENTIYLGSWEGEVLALRTTDGSIAWRQRIDLMDFGIGTPVAVANGTVFGAGREGTIVALSATDGRIEWRVSTEMYELGAPSVADGAVYVGEASQSGSGTLLALEAATGDELWRVETREVLFGDYTRSGINLAPAVVEDLIYVATAPGDLYAVAGDQ